MALSKASCTGRGLIPAIGGHVHRMFDEGEDDLFSLSLHDVMDDRPWTADELMGGGAARPSSPNPALAPKTASAPTPAQSAVSTPAPTPAPTSAPTPAPRPASDPSETAAFLAAATQGKSADSTVMYSAQQLPVPAARKPPVARLDEPVAHQVAYDSWAATDLDETSTGMPALDVPVNPLLPPTRAPQTMRAVRHIPIIPMAMLATVASRPRTMAPRRAIIPTIRTLPRPHRNMTRRPRPRRRIPKARAKSASPIITPRKRHCVSRNFRRQSRLPLSPLSLPCSVSLRLRDSGCSPAPPKRSRRPSKKRTITSIWTSTPSRATPTTGTTSSEG